MIKNQAHQAIMHSFAGVNGPRVNFTRSTLPALLAVAQERNRLENYQPEIEIPSGKLT